jgi:hypothetical protein
MFCSKEVLKELDEKNPYYLSTEEMYDRSQLYAMERLLKRIIKKVKEMEENNGT